MTEKYRVIGHSRDRQKWLDTRRSHIGASDAAAVMGISKRKDPLTFYLERRGEIQPEDFSNNDLVQCGIDLESAIRDVIFPRKSGRIAIPGGELLQSIEHPWATCTVDGWTRLHDAAPRHPLEIKNVIAFAESEWESGAPAHYALQCQHQMLVTGASVATICALIGGCKPAWEDIVRDDWMIGKLIEAGQDMMRRIKDGDAPPPNDTEQCERALGLWHPKSEPKTVQLPAECRRASEQWEELKREEKSLKKRLLELKNLVKYHMGDAELGVIRGVGSFSWKSSISGVRTLRHHPPRKRAA